MGRLCSSSGYLGRRRRCYRWGPCGKTDGSSGLEMDVFDHIEIQKKCTTEPGFVYNFYKSFSYSA